MINADRTERYYVALRLVGAPFRRRYRRASRRSLGWQTRFQFRRDRSIRGGRYSLAFAIKAALDKYLDHIPLARQERILRRHGLEITTQALWDQLSALGQRLAQTEAALFAHALTAPVIGLDQTSWPKLEPGATKPRQTWCVTAPGVLCHRIKSSESPLGCR